VSPGAGTLETRLAPGGSVGRQELTSWNQASV